VKERVHHGWGMGEATKGSEGLRNLTKGSLGSGSKSERRFDACQQGMNIQSFAETRRRARGICYFWILAWYSNLKLELRVIGIAGPSWRREGRAVMRRGGRVVMWREVREVMSSGPIDSVNISKLELRVLGIKAPARGEGPGAVES